MRNAIRVSMGACVAAIVTAGAGCATGPAVRTSDDLPLRRVVLYRNGVGYFERQGQFDGDALEFQVRRKDVGDFLSSLTAVDSKGQVRSVSFEMDDKKKKKDEKPPPPPGPIPLPKDRAYIIVPPDHPPSSGDDGASADEKDDRVNVRLRLAGDEHHMSVSYVVAAPIWKPTYRVVFDDDGALLQAWAVVQNQSGEDWNNVLLSLTTGAPIAFRSDLGTPVTPPRPLVTDRGEVVYSVPSSETSLAQTEQAPKGAAAPAAPPPPAEKKAEAPAASRAAMPMRARRSSGGMMDESSANLGALQEPAPQIGAGEMQHSLVTAAAAATLSTGVTRYDFQHPVTVPNGGSTMVAILSKRIPGQAAYLYAPDGGVPDSQSHPFRVARFTNHTGAMLERGPIAVIGDGGFLGQGVLDPLPRDATTFVPFALDRSIAIEPNRSYETRPGRLIKVSHGQVVVETMQARVTRYAIRNGNDHKAKIYVRHPRMAGAELWQPPAGVELSPGKALVPVTVPAHGKTKLVVEERTPARRTVSFLSDEAATAVKLYLEGSAVDAAQGPTLRKALELRDRLQTVQQAIADMQSQRDEVERTLNETRSNLEAVKKVSGAADLRQRLVRRISELDQKDSDLTKSIVEKKTEQSELRVRLDATINEITLVVPDRSSKK